MNMKKTEEELLAAFDEIEELKAKLAAQKKNGKKSPPMKKLNYLFSDSQPVKIKSLGESLDMPESDIARSAMFIGLKKLEELSKDDKRKAKGMIHISKIRLMIIGK